MALRGAKDHSHAGDYDIFSSSTLNPDSMPAYIRKFSLILTGHAIERETSGIGQLRCDNMYLLP